MLAISLHKAFLNWPLNHVEIVWPFQPRRQFWLLDWVGNYLIWFAINCESWIGVLELEVED